MMAWLWRLRVAEAACLLVAARVLVAALALKHWRQRLGPAGSIPSSGSPPGPRERDLARAVLRADFRLPIGCKCLQRALALHWMLRRRRLPSQLVIAAPASADRRSMDDLHAWVESGGELLIGAPDRPHHAIIRFG